MDERSLLEEEKLLRELLMRQNASENLADFARYVVEVEPAEHHRLICHKLDEVVSGKCKRLIICAPPGSAKSTYTSLILPAYYMAKKPGSLVLAASHTAELADTFGKRVRNLVNSTLFKNVFPEIVISGDNRAAARWSINNESEYFGIGAGGGIAGRRASLLLIDDPYKTRQDAHSDTVRSRITEWYFADARPRLLPDAPVILIQTRWHEDDLAGHLLREMEEGSGQHWDTIILPAICEQDFGDPIGRKKGEALWPDWQNLKDLIEIKEGMPTISDWNSLYQQHPSDPEGEMVNRSWIKYYKELPSEKMMIINSWDTAGTVGARSAYTTCLTIGKTPSGDYYLLNVFREKIEFPEIMNAIPSIYRSSGAHKCIIEDKNTGQSAIQLLRHRAINLIAQKPQQIGDKEYRFELVTPVFQSGRFYVPERAPWREVFEEELFAFPNSRYKDQVDALSQAISEMEKHRGVRGMAKLRMAG